MITKFLIFEQQTISDIEILKLPPGPLVFRNKLANVNNIKKKIEYQYIGDVRKKLSESYTIKYTNYFHREDGPAYQKWYDNGQKLNEIYYKEGKKHREDGPASLEWYSNGQIKYIMYFIDAKCHREDGPAFQKFDINGKFEMCDYYLNFKKYKIEDWLEELKNMNSPYYEEQLLKYSANKYNL
jgi:hypothetical protein